MSELEEVASRIWHEALARHSRLAWHQLPRDSAEYRRAMAAALTALGCGGRPLPTLLSLPLGRPA
ncbi:hypothetical protein CLG96_11545 [Sphingomonas oleivorans]|uniref:Uncharacterized protein n=1 Tax=Sphingomonas oleivorans TaxID=1735121 RepID=A0A2T5FVJ9_9SPHN|nr:hypothetical protein [Sphingomonas oleivorans]PTQ09806.1 hypothetical protein CLG96_11545 [Sphingomonas oleivorans]